MESSAAVQVAFSTYRNTVKTPQNPDDLFRAFQTTTKKANTYLTPSS